MLGDSGDMLVTSATAAGGSQPPPPVVATGTSNESEVGHVGTSNSCEDDKGRVGEGHDRSFGGNRWPKQETLALLQIRSDMDSAFRDASSKGPLWDEVSRKLGELGYNRSAKKCREKFENVYKYHKRTKKGRVAKSEGKTYKFFDQLKAFEHHHQPSTATAAAVVAARSMPPVSGVVIVTLTDTVPSTATTVAATTTTTTTTTDTTNICQGTFAIPTMQNLQSIHAPVNPSQFNTPSFSSDPFSISMSSSTSSDVETQGQHRRKRKWKDCFDKLMREIITKQEQMQKRLIETIEKCEHERMIREEAWRIQEMTRINKEREILAQERSISASKDTALMSFLQKLSDEQNPAGKRLPITLPVITQTSQPSPPTSVPSPSPALHVPAANVGSAAEAAPRTEAETLQLDNVNQVMISSPSSSSLSLSRWPKEEIQALINIRTSLDSKYQENVPKGPLWEEISAEMRRVGYNRNAKRCKEKWENINKYFKKVKESNKKRPEDSKTCPYFHQLDALYKHKHNNKLDLSKQPLNSVPLMVRPQQQWPPLPQNQEEERDLESNQDKDTQKDG